MRNFFVLYLALGLIAIGSVRVFGQAGPRGFTWPSATSRPASESEGLSLFPKDPLPPAGRRYALCIGIDGYSQDSGYPALHCAVADAKSLGAVFEALGYRTIVMTDDGAGIHNGAKPDPLLIPTSANLKRVLLDFARQAKNPDDELVISYAGHGDVFDNQAAIVPIDYSNKAHNLVTVSSILGPLNDPQCHASSKLLLLDACHSGSGDKGFLLGFANEKSLMVFSACSANQSSLEDVATDPAHGPGHGRFTAVIMRGLVGPAFSPPATQPAGDAPIAEWNGEAYVNQSEFLSATQLSDYVGRIFAKNGWARKAPTAPGAPVNMAGQNPHIFGEQDTTVPMIVARRKVAIKPPPLTNEDFETIRETLAKARSAYEKRDWVAMINHATTVLRIQDGNKDALAFRALGNLRSTYIDKAEEDAQAALQSDPQQAMALQVDGVCAAGSNDKLHAIKSLHEASRLIDAHPADWPLLATGEEAAYRMLATGIAADGQESVDCLTKAAASPDLPADTRSNIELVLGLKYENGTGIPQDYAMAMQWYQKGSADGNSSAMLAIGLLYESGHGVPQDYAKAMTYYRTSADRGNAGAITRMGYLFEKGLGIPQDFTQALLLYHQAADLLGNAAAMNRIGYMYEHGQGFPKPDLTQAMFWHRKAADGQDAMAMNNIGSLYFYGLGQPQDYAQALSWWRKGADLGSAEAMCGVGHLYDAGHGVGRDYSQAMSWYHKASDAGSAVAMFNIGSMYDQG